MIQSYQKVLKMESVASLKLEKDRKALEKLRTILYQEKDFIIDRLIIFLKRELDIDYFRYKIIDIDDNIFDILVKKDSKIFKEHIDAKDYLSFNAECLIDSRKFDNKNEVIIINFSFDEETLNLGYLCDTLSYEHLSYSKEIIDRLTTFIEYVINKKILKK